MTSTPLAAAIDLLRERTGIVISVYFGSDHDADIGGALLGDTVAGFLREVSRPDAICLSVDGPGPAIAVADAVAAETGVSVIHGSENRGKLGAVMDGARELLRDECFRYIALVDQDGDHFPNELLNLVRGAEHVASVSRNPEVYMIGRRTSRHRPMGYLRGEMEELADRMLLDALYYDAAKSGAPLDLRFALALDEYPDFHSGYKLLSRASAEAVFCAEPRLEGRPRDCAFRHAVEAVVTVEALAAGATLAQVNRSTFDEQPLTTFGQLKRCPMIADKIIWPCKRLGVPAAFVGQWLDNHLPRLQLSTLAPDGREELFEIRRLVRDAFDLPDDGVRDMARPLFV
jgi:Glycosyl transferase family 2